ncbi:MAG: hypothetical protein QM705_00915 [Ancrocorticia sp.]
MGKVSSLILRFFSNPPENKEEIYVDRQQPMILPFMSGDQWEKRYDATSEKFPRWVLWAVAAPSSLALFSFMGMVVSSSGPMEWNLFSVLCASALIGLFSLYIFRGANASNVVAFAMLAMGLLGILVEFIEGNSDGAFYGLGIGMLTIAIALTKSERIQEPLLILGTPVVIVLQALFFHRWGQHESDMASLDRSETLLKRCLNEPTIPQAECWINWDSSVGLAIDEIRRNTDQFYGFGMFLLCTLLASIIIARQRQLKKLRENSRLMDHYHVMEQSMAYRHVQDYRSLARQARARRPDDRKTHGRAYHRSPQMRRLNSLRKTT